MKTIQLKITTHGEGFSDITSRVKELIKPILEKRPNGVLTLFLQHTSCALTINEAYDPLAAKDMEEFLKHLAKRNLPFIKHTDEGPDDSPSHMKCLITGHSIQIPVESSQLLLGTWQGIYLCEFRDDTKERTILLKYQPDSL